MRNLFDRRLTDPTAAEVIEAIVAAERAANAGHKKGNLVPCGTSAPAIAARVLAEREGMNGHFGTADRPANIGRLSLGWWTNTAGRKFVRVRSWREWSDRYDEVGVQTEEFDQRERHRHRRPGVWHVDHESIVEASTGGEPEWVAVCGCGATGSPASLGWQHGMCGPCADRIAEFGPDVVKHTPGLLVPDLCSRDVLFTPGGKFVVAAGDAGFRMWDAATGSLRGAGDFPDLPDVRPVASPDGRFVFLADDYSGGLFLSPADNSVRTPFTVGGNVRAAHWTGQPDELLVQNDTGSLHIANAVDGHLRAVSAPPESGAKLCALWSDSPAPRAVFAAGYLGAVARVSRQGKLTVESRFNLGEGRLNRTGLWHGGPTITRFTPDGARLLFIRGTEMELRHPAKPKALVQAEFPQPVRDAAFSPDYEHLFILGADGTLYVCNPGSLTGVRAQFRWHLGPVWKLAVSPDGQTLATAGSEGVKIWTVGQLLPLLE